MDRQMIDVASERDLVNETPAAITQLIEYGFN